MITKLKFVDRFVLETSGQVKTGENVTSTSFLRLLMPRGQLVEFIERISQHVSLPVSRQEITEFLDTGNYNVNDLYDFLVDRKEARMTARQQLIARILLFISVILTVYSLFNVWFLPCFVFMGIGSGLFKYLMSSRQT